MKRIIVVLSLWLFVQHSFSQEEKLRVAVFDPTSSGTAIDEGTKIAIRELVSSTYVNTGKYIMVERSLLERVMKEQEFSNSGVVDDNQATEIGKLAGAHKVVLSIVTLVGGRNMLSVKIIDVKTATIEQQKTKLVQTNDLLDIVEPLTLELIGVAIDIQSTPSLLQKNVEEKTTEISPVNSSLPNAVSGNNVVLHFAGFFSNKNPAARIFVDGALVGNGTLSQGFSVSFAENRVGEHKVRIEWSSMIDSKTFKIDTSFKKQFNFEYDKGGFGYEFRIIK